MTIFTKTNGTINVDELTEREIEELVDTDPDFALKLEIEPSRNRGWYEDEDGMIWAC